MRFDAVSPGHSMRRAGLGTVVALIAAVSPWVWSAPRAAWAAAGSTIRVSVDSGGVQADKEALQPAVSGDGRYVAFSSAATNLVAGDTNSVADVFVRDVQTGVVTRASVDSATVANQANSNSSQPAISADGRYVAFSSSASNLVTGDTNSTPDIFLRDRWTGLTLRVSVDSGGNQTVPGPALSAASAEPAISPDGRYVAFSSLAANLVAGDTNNVSDIFVHDMKSGITTRASVDSATVPNQADNSSFRPAVSADGRSVAFWSVASNLVSGDTNNNPDVFVHDTLTGSTTRASVDSAGNQANADQLESGAPAISGDGRYLAFSSFATNLVAGDTNGTSDVFVRDLQTGVTSRVSVDSAGSQASGGASQAAISGDGRSVAFSSYAANLVGGDTNDSRDVFVHDLQTGGTTRASVDSSGGQGNGASGQQFAISNDGHSVGFVSYATNLVAGDTNGLPDVFVHATGLAAATVTMTSPINGRGQAAVAVGGTGQAGTSAHISVDDANPTTVPVTATAVVGSSGYSATLDLSPLSDGTVTATVGLTDTAGATSATASTSAFKDTIAPAAPTVNLTTAGTTATVSGTGESGTIALITIDDTDAATAALVTSAAVGSSGYSVSIDISSLSLGTTTATVGLTDGVGNTGPSATATSQRTPAYGRHTIAAGYGHSLAVKSDGTVWAWGKNSSGQLGNNTASNSLIPVPVSGLAGVVEVAAGYSHSLALKADGTVWAWGSNAFGELGNNTTTERHGPVQVSGLTGVIAVAAGAGHSLALKADGTVWGWGYNYFGELGNNTTTNSKVPVAVTGLTGAVAIAAGGRSPGGHSLAVKSDGTVRAWGQNTAGQLGNNTTTNSKIPVTVGGLTGVVGIAAGESHSLAVRSDGSGWAWGQNTSGQLGNNTATNSRVPVQVSNLSGTVAVAAGGAHSLALKSDGTVSGWGSGSYGELGNNAILNSKVPVQASGLSSGVAIASGSRHSLALKSGRTTWGWGYNHEGEIGNNSTADSRVPLQSNMSSASIPL